MSVGASNRRTSSVSCPGSLAQYLATAAKASHGNHLQDILIFPAVGFQKRPGVSPKLLRLLSNELPRVASDFANGITQSVAPVFSIEALAPSKHVADAWYIMAAWPLVERHEARRASWSRRFDLFVASPFPGLWVRVLAAGFCTPRVRQTGHSLCRTRSPPPDEICTMIQNWNKRLALEIILSAMRVISTIGFLRAAPPALQK